MPFPAPSPSASAPSALAAFAARLFRHLDRSDQRRWGYTYLAALLDTPGKKTVRRLAGTVSDSPGVARALNQFVNGSTWDWEPVLDELTAWAAERGRPRAWAVHPVLLPKRGEASAGVHHRFDPRSGRTVSCQLGLVGLGCGDVAVPAAWQLVLPPSWTADGERRRRARIPETEDHLPMWRRELAMADRLVGSSAAVPIVIDARDDPDAVRLIRELAERRWTFAVAVPPTLPVLLSGWTAQYPLPTGREPLPAIDARSGPATFLTATAYLPGIDGDADMPCLLVATRTADGRPGRIWVAAAGAPAAQAAELVRLGDETADVVATLRDRFGLADFEGRSFPGWHRHMTLVSAAYTFQFAGAV